ncbi:MULTISPECIES: AAA family ATPase [unclassified Pseudomonas]|uniref:AAA family ATPase n=1 Tax=unclassified Pseudomonas TaxID=196821 RepID=UPI001C477090|nr:MULTISPECIES: AAA family ATPase [unclassified Pseudomonas]MBV7527150.1 ATP-binding protein [Pseudomonas sp. PDM29]
MLINSIEFKNFRLLRDVSFWIEEHTTLIVGRNNFGKTSIVEVFRRLLSDKTPSFRLKDFSLRCREKFFQEFQATLAVIIASKNAGEHTVEGLGITVIGRQFALNDIRGRQESVREHICTQSVTQNFFRNSLTSG